MALVWPGRFERYFISDWVQSHLGPVNAAFILQTLAQMFLTGIEPI